MGNVQYVCNIICSFIYSCSANDKASKLNIKNAEIAHSKFSNLNEELSYNEYKPTNPLSIYFVMELNYDLGYLAKGNCAERIKFYSFIKIISNI